MDYRRFRDSIQDKQHIAIIGAGLIGCEFANDLSNGGYQVAVIAPSSSPLERLLPASVGGSLQEALAKQGIAWYLNRSVVSLNQAESNYQLILSDGQVLTADAVLSAIGLRPHTALAKAAGIAIKQGISVNQFLQTNIANIYALGDCAEVASHALQYVAPIVLCARALAQTLAGIPTPIHYPAMPIIIKTPAYPIVVCPPVLNNSDGTWQIEQHQTGMRALFHDLQGKLQGFVLTGSLTNDRMALTQQLPDWLAAFKQ